MLILRFRSHGRLNRQYREGENDDKPKEALAGRQPRRQGAQRPLPGEPIVLRHEENR
jgi:hypothetical protein